MSDTPEGNICKVSANLGWASDTLAMVDKALLKLSAEVKTILRERDNFQDQRDFAMGEIERLRKERDEAREAFAVATSQAVEAREMLRRIMDWSPCLPEYEPDAQHLKWQADAFAARKFLEAAK